MGLWNVVKRFAFYGGITLAVTQPIAYKVGYNRGVLEATMLKPSGLEKIAENQYTIINPADNRTYRLDFNTNKIMPYKKERTLEEIFSR